MVTGSDEAGSELGAPAPRRREPLGWHGLAGICLGIVAVVLGGRYFLNQDDLRARLMRAEPGSIVQDGELRAFAVATAQPVYDGRCASCHGDQMQGDRSRGIPSFSGRKWLYGEGRVAEIELQVAGSISGSLRSRA